MKARENSPPPAFRRARYAKTTGDESGSVAFGPTSASMDNTLHDLHNSSHPTRQPHSITAKYARPIVLPFNRPVFCLVEKSWCYCI